MSEEENKEEGKQEEGKTRTKVELKVDENKIAEKVAQRLKEESQSKGGKKDNSSDEEAVAKLKAEHDKELEEKEKELEKMRVEKEKAEEELNTKTAILEKAAIERFEKEKNDILELCKNSKLNEEQVAEIEEKLQTPEDISKVKSLVNMLVSFIPKEEEKLEGEKPKKIPQGKAPITPPPEGDQYEGGVQMIDSLYDMAYGRHLDGKWKYPEKQRSEADMKVRQLIQSLIDGKSWKQMKEGIGIDKIMSTIKCPGCGRTIVGEVPDKCPYPDCNFNFAKTGDRGQSSRGI